MDKEDLRSCAVDQKIRFNTFDHLERLTDLKESLFQRNKHPDEQIIRLAKIMREEGIYHPISVSTRSGRIAFGHGRKEAALLNAWQYFPIVYQHFDDDDQEYRVVQSDNAISQWSELDLSKINQDIQSGTMGPFDIELLGIEGFVVEPADKLISGVEINEKELDENIETHNECPSCAYRW